MKFLYALIVSYIHRKNEKVTKILSVLCVSVVIMLCLISNIPANAEEGWFFPLEVKAGISSNFGEFRGNRVHTGVDLRTNGVTGYKVYAIQSGKVVRLCVKKLGFGNAIYIQHPNGQMSVYAHLDRFVEEGLGLRSIVKQYQKKRGTKYPGNIYLEKPVKRGQLIGYSGETGYGLPHLHFELRQGGAIPIDPFEHGFDYEDTTPPVIESFLIEPLGSQSFVDGEHWQQEYAAEQEQGQYVVKEIPRIHGKVRFTASMFDQIGAQNRVGVDQIDLYIAYSGVDQLDLYVDQDTYFSNQFDKVTYSTNHRGGLVYDYNFTRLSNPSRYYYRLYNISPQNFPYRKVFSKNKGIWDTATAQEGLHTVTLEIRDVKGNLSVAQMQVFVEKQPSVQLAYPPLQKGWTMQVREFQGFIEVIAQTADALRDVPTLQIEQQKKKSQTLKLTPRGKNLFSATYDLTPGRDGVLELTVRASTQDGTPLEGTRTYPVQTVFAKKGGTVHYGSKASMTFPAGALYENIFANIFPTTAYESTDGLPVIGEVYDFRPAGCPLEKRGSIRIQYPVDANNVQQLGIFWWDAIKQRWYFMDDRRDSKAHSLTAKIIYPSIYAILRDTVKPVISRLKPESGSTVNASLDEVSARISDRGKGVDEGSIVVTLDGKRVDGEYDPDRDTYTYELTGKLSAGKHTLVVNASDKAGHAAVSKTSTFVVE